MRYGNGSGPILLDNLMCSGKENTLLDCSSNAVWVNDCGHSEDAGVVCNGEIRQPNLKIAPSCLCLQSLVMGTM